MDHRIVAGDDVLTCLWKIGSVRQWENASAQCSTAFAPFAHATVLQADLPRYNRLQAQG
jgi:hypothetical protein